MRVRGQSLDIVAVALYYPPAPGKAAQNAVYARTCEKLTDWLQGLPAMRIARCTPLVFTDLNSGFGYTKGAQGVWQRVVDERVGPLANDRQRLPAENLLPCLGPWISRCRPPSGTTGLPTMERARTAAPSTMLPFPLAWLGLLSPVARSCGLEGSCSTALPGSARTTCRCT